MSSLFNIDFIESITQIESSCWNGIINTDYPFIQYDFLLGLEKSGATTNQSGWQPYHLIVRVDDEIKALMPLYIKGHSYAEYVFDHAWADAYYRNGLDYYPKLVSSIPFTPSVGQRVYSHDSVDQNALMESILQAIKELCEKNQFSSWHLLFPLENEIEGFESLNCLSRVGVQYHWFNQDNKNENYQSFEHFLENCKTKPRKNIRRERRLVEQQGIMIHQYEGKAIPVELWQQLFTFYEDTYLKRSGHAGYLNKGFFDFIAKYLTDHTMVISAELNQQVVAAALFFKDKKTLYGRYWGCLEEFNCLHFELCYYQGIEYCIKHKLDRFDAGAQGEHKIPRGFKPIKTYSSHWIARQDFSMAIHQFIQEESKQIDTLLPILYQKLPYK